MKRLKAIPFYLILLLVVPTAIGKYNAIQRRLGQEQLRTALLTARGDSLQSRIRFLETRVLKPQVDTFIRWKRVFDTLPPLIPDLLKPDAPPVPAAQLANVIFVAQNTVEACQTALTTCQVLQLKKDTLITIRTKERDYYKQQVPTAFDRYIEWGIRIGFFYLGTRAK